MEAESVVVNVVEVVIVEGTEFWLSLVVFGDVEPEVRLLIINPK